MLRGWRLVRLVLGLAVVGFVALMAQMAYVVEMQHISKDELISKDAQIAELRALESKNAVEIARLQQELANTKETFARRRVEDARAAAAEKAKQGAAAAAESGNSKPRIGGVVKAPGPLAPGASVGRAVDAYPKEAKYRVFLAIASGYQTPHRRDGSRETWLTIKHDPSVVFQYRFFVGQPVVSVPALDEEMAQYDDVVMLSVKDEWRQLANKTLHMMEWVSKQFKADTVDFVVKVDDDSFVRLDVLADVIKTLPKTKLYAGMSQYGYSPNRWGDELIRVSKEDYAEDGWKGFAWCNGFFYILSPELANFIGGRARQKGYPKLFLEDVNTGMTLSEFDPQLKSHSLAGMMQDGVCQTGYLMCHRAKMDVFMAALKSGDNGGCPNGVAKATWK